MRGQKVDYRKKIVNDLILEGYEKYGYEKIYQ